MKASVFMLISVLVLPALVNAQWTKVADRAIGPVQADCCGFGSIVFKDGLTWAGHDDIYLSRDSGASWKKVASALGSAITELSFADTLNGIAATRDGLYATHDQGKTWNQIFSHIECFGAEFAGSANDIVMTCDYGGNFYSTNGGATWAFFDPGGHEHAVLGLSDGRGFAFSAANDPSPAAIFTTSDHGKTWAAAGPGIAYDCWTMGIDSCDANAIYLVNEEGHIPDDGNAELFKLNTVDHTWTTVFSKPGRFLSGSITASKNAMYVGTLSDGIYRTTDRGKNWKSIGGPSANIDTRLVCAITDNIVIACDNTGSLWRTTNSGGDSVKAPSPGKLPDFAFSSARIIKDSFNVTVRLPIYLHHNTPMPSIDVVMHYPAANLTYLGSFLFYGKSIDVAGSRWAGRAKLHIDADDLNALPDSLVGFAAFQWYPYESDCAFVNFDSLPITIQNDACSLPTTTWGKGFRGIIGSYPWCGTDGIRTVATPDVPLFSVTPNPAHNRIELHSSLYDGPVDLRIVDLAGRVITTTSGYLSNSNPIALDVSALASGTYTLSISGPSLVPFAIKFVHQR